MLTVHEIKLVLEEHACLCLDNERERARVATALHKAMKAAVPSKRKVKK